MKKQVTTSFKKIVLTLISIVVFATGAKAVNYSGNYNVGTAGTWTNLTNAFTAISAGTVTGNVTLTLVTGYPAAAETFPIVPSTNAGAFTITIFPGVTGLTIGGSSATGIINLNGSKNITFDGRVNQAGAMDLIVTNTGTGYTFQLINDATSNTIKYCNVKGVGTTTATAVILFSTTTGTTGNDNNTIDHCDIHDGATTPLDCIYSLGTASPKDNSNNTISNCNIYNFYIASTVSIICGIDIEAGNTDWTITGNSLYQTSARVPTAAMFMEGILINNTSGNNFTISNNYIGGSSASCGGGAMSLDAGQTQDNDFYAMNVQVGATTASTIQNNTIANINYGAKCIAGVYAFLGIATGPGYVNVTGNTIGSATGNGSITLTLSTSGTKAFVVGGILFGDGGAPSMKGSVTNNIVGSITVTGGKTTKTGDIRALEADATLLADVTISGNLFGSTTTANSIQYTSGAVTPVSMLMVFLGTVGPTFNITLSNNTISNITNTSTGSTEFTAGIWSQSTTLSTITGNTIKNMSSAATAATGDMIGIYAGDATAGQTISNNSIHDLSCSSATASAVVNAGIYYSGPTTGTNTISANTVYNLTLSSTSTAAIIHGISISSGIANTINNMVTLGNGVTTGYTINGIRQLSATAGNNYYFNSVYIGGTVGAAGTNTSGIITSSTATRTITSNIFYNARTGGTAKHFAINVSGTTGLTSNCNDLYSSVAANLGTYDAGTTSRTFAAWQAIPQDAASYNTDPVYNDPTNATTPNLHLLNAVSSPNDHACVVALVTTDIDGETRSGTTPDIGADENCASSAGGSSYAIYAPDGSAVVTDCELYGGTVACARTACLVCTPSSVSYTNVSVSTYPVIFSGDVTNNYTNCTGVNMNMTTASTSPDWTGSATTLTGAGTPKTVSYTSTGRKTVLMTSTSVAAATYSATVSAAIPDVSCTGASNTIAVAGYSTAIASSGITVTVNMAHARSNDLYLYLTAPNGDVLNLMTGTGAAGVNLTNTVFSDAGATTITSGSTPWTGTWKPTGSLASIGCTPVGTRATFAAIGGGSYNPNGNWTLKVIDAVGTNTGTFTNWSISFPGISAANTYTDFNDMLMAAPSAGTVSGATNVCPGTYNFASSVAGTPGFVYSWSVLPAGATIASSTASSTNITLPNATGANITYTVTCTVTSECCGVLPAVTYNSVIYPIPAAPTAAAASSTPCPGSSDILTATLPAGASFNWYTASSGGTLLGTGLTYTVNPVVAGATTYYVETVNASGCISSTRTPVTVTGTATTAPTVTGGTSCGAGNITVSVSSPVAGYTYNFYTGSCGGTLVQSSTSTVYTAYTSSTTTYYISATAPGCAASSCNTATATITAPPNPIYWLGVTPLAGTNNWFNTTNWTGGCLPTCVSDVIINPIAGTIISQPDIGFNAAGSAACHTMNLNAGSILSFSDSKAELDVCGDFNHTGTLTSNNLGLVVFMGTTGQTYTKTAPAANNDFNSVDLNNTAATPTLTYVSGDMILGTSGSFTFISGKVLTGTNKLIIKNTAPASVSGHAASRYVQGVANGTGNLRRYISNSVLGSYDFPVGLTTYELANVNFTSLPTTLTYLTANFQTYGAIPGPINKTECNATYNQNALNNGFWEIDADNTPNNTGVYNMTLYNTNYSNAASGWTVMAKHNGSATWDIINGDGSSGTCIPSPVTAVVRNNMKGFSFFGNAQAATILPVSFLSFEAGYNGKSNDLNWTTATEVNCSYFDIQRSTDGENFVSIAKIPTKAFGGNSNTQLSYYLNDPDVAAGIYYYRLKQYDVNNSFKYSEIATVTIDDGSDVFNVKPNPTTSTAEVTYMCYSSENATVKVYDNRGRLVVSKDIQCEKGKNSAVIDLSEHADGMYFITLSTNNKVYKTKIIKHNN